MRQMTAQQVIAAVAKQIGPNCRPRDVIEALCYNCVIDEVRQQIEWLDQERKGILNIDKKLSN